MRNVILGCGDIGRRIVSLLISHDVAPADIHGYAKSDVSLSFIKDMAVGAHRLDLDSSVSSLNVCHGALVYYCVPPQSDGQVDKRSRAILAEFEKNTVVPKKVCVISTTGVYGDCSGEWVDESTPTRPQTMRGKRRLDAETQWLNWGQRSGVGVVVLRVPGIYAYSRLPRVRLERGAPVVRAGDCGYTNRVHADDLARMCVSAMDSAKPGSVFNASDGVPGKISEYLQAAAKLLGFPPLPELSMDEAQLQLSDGMLSYLSESRKISNVKIVEELCFELKYSDYREGLKHG